MPKLYYEAKWFTIILFFTVGVFFGALALFIFVFNGGQLYGIQKVHPPRDPKYTLIDPLLAVETQPQLNFLVGNSLENHIYDAAGFSKDKSLENRGLYFRDIENGRWVGIKEKEIFSPGKFLKVPLMVAFFKQAETDPNILDTLIKYTGTSTAEIQNQNVTLPKAGRFYTILDLIKESVLSDDNNTASILLGLVDKDLLADIYHELGIKLISNTATVDQMNIQQYALFFRVLYNATYLDKEMSNTALEILTHTRRDLGFAAAIPNDLTIAHRFHIRTLSDGRIEANDCGMVYFPDHPYELCASLIGSDLASVNRALYAIGDTTFQNMKSLYDLK